MAVKARRRRGTSFPIELDTAETAASRKFLAQRAWPVQKELPTLPQIMVLFGGVKLRRFPQPRPEGTDLTIIRNIVEQYAGRRSTHRLRVSRVPRFGKKTSVVAEMWAFWKLAPKRTSLDGTTGPADLAARNGRYPHITLAWRVPAGQPKFPGSRVSSRVGK